MAATDGRRGELHKLGREGSIPSAATRAGPDGKAPPRHGGDEQVRFLRRARKVNRPGRRARFESGAHYGVGFECSAFLDLETMRMSVLRGGLLHRWATAPRVQLPPSPPSSRGVK